MKCNNMNQYQINDINEILLTLFKGHALIDGDEYVDNPGDMMKECIRLGYVLDKCQLTTSVYRWLIDQRAFFDKTMYSTWNDIISRSEIDLLFDQIFHYISTYGTNFNSEPFILNGDIELPEISKFKILPVLSTEDITKKIFGMIESGAALSSTTLSKLLSLIKYFDLTDKIDIDKIKNKEMMSMLMDLTGRYPSNVEDMVRYLVYVSTNQTLVIKNKLTFHNIQSGINNEKDKILKALTEYDINKYASVFLRYKPLFLAMRSLKEARPIINKIRRLSEKHHEPYRFKYFENILSRKEIDPNLDSKLNNLTNFKKICLINSLNERIYNATSNEPYVTNVYRIRNGKTYISVDSKKFDKVRLDYYENLKCIIFDNLINSIKGKACRIKLPRNLYIAAPTSEKNFVGDIPFGSYVKLTDQDAIVGISWHLNDGAHDIDLSYIDTTTGAKIGWNSSYKNGSGAMYSGDVTNSANGACELIYMPRLTTQGVIKANLYFGDQNSKFDIFVASERITNIKKNYMINPNNLIFKYRLSFDDSHREKTIGLVLGNRFIFTDLILKNKRVSGIDDLDVHIKKYYQSSSVNMLSLRDVLTCAGFSIVTDDEITDVEIDLSNLDRSNLISIFS